MREGWFCSNIGQRFLLDTQAREGRMLRLAQFTGWEARTGVKYLGIEDGVEGTNTCTGVCDFVTYLHL